MQWSADLGAVRDIELFFPVSSLSAELSKVNWLLAPYLQYTYGSSIDLHMSFSSREQNNAFPKISCKTIIDVFIYFLHMS